MEVPLDPDEPIAAHLDYPLSDRPITRLHVHECLELGCCHAGHGVFMIGGQVRTFAAGAVVVIPAGEPHLASSAPGTSSRWTWLYLAPERLLAPGVLDATWLDTSALRGSGFEHVFASETYPALARAVCRLAEECAGNLPGRAMAIRALVTEILVQAQRQRTGSASEAGLSVRHDYRRLAPALQAMARDFPTPLRMDELARRCGLSEPQFRRVFRETMGCAPLSYLHAIRVHTAAALLRGTTKSVLEIGLETGFESVSSLHRVFRSHLGTSPRRWRSASR